MNYWLDGNDLVIKKLFGEKRYSFRELTKISLKEEFYVYAGDKCILHDKNFYIHADLLIDMLNLSIKNGVIFEDKVWFKDEILVQDVHAYSAQIQEKIKQETYDYVKQKLGEEYELVIAANETAYHAALYFYVYRNGESVCIDDARERQFYTTQLNGKKDIPLTWFELVMPHYLNLKTQEFKLTKKIDVSEDIYEIKAQINRIKDCGAVPVSQFV